MLEIIVASKPQEGEAESERVVFYQSKKQTNCISAAEAGQDITLWREMQLTEKIYSKTLKKREKEKATTAYRLGVCFTTCSFGFMPISLFPLNELMFYLQQELHVIVC